MLEKIANQARKHILTMITEAQSGHPGGSLSCVDILTYLIHEEVKMTPETINNDRDKIVLSKGHAAPALYALLALANIIDINELTTLRKINSRLQGHPNMNDTPGVDMSTGSLGQGISAAVGMALANKIDNKPFYTYCVLGDGECEEGQVYEALMAASQYKLKNLILFIDFNGLQIDGNITDILNPCPFKEKFEAFGFDTYEIDGHSFKEIENAIKNAKQTELPSVIIAHTIKGKGVSFMENQANWHGKAPSKEQLDQALNELNQKETSL